MVRVCVEDGFRKKSGEEGRGGEGREVVGVGVVVWVLLEMGMGWLVLGVMGCVRGKEPKYYRFLSI